MIIMSDLGSFENKTILVTGCAGFIGGSLALRLLDTAGVRIVGIDNVNDYYETSLKEYRLERIRTKDTDGRFVFIRGDIADKKTVIDAFEKYLPDIVIHLAAQAGVRYSIDNPDAYIQSNIIGTFNILEACRFSMDKGEDAVEHLLFASSSSVYGDNEKIPYSEADNTDRPVSLYAATKKADEALAYSYAKLYKIPMTGMRFFTVYGPAGRPDMAYYKFTKKLAAGEMIELYNKGENKRDFTYVDDVLESIEKLITLVPPVGGQGERYRIYNIGNNSPVDTKTFVAILMEELKSAGVIDKGLKFEDLTKLVDAAPGDVLVTYADIEKLYKDTGSRPHTELREGLARFAKWYKEYAQTV